MYRKKEFVFSWTTFATNYRAYILCINYYPQQWYISYSIYASKYIYMPFYKVVSFYPLCQLVSDTIHIKIIQELQTLRFWKWNENKSRFDRISTDNALHIYLIILWRRNFCSILIFWILSRLEYGDFRSFLLFWIHSRLQYGNLSSCVVNSVQYITYWASIRFYYTDMTWIRS